MSDDVDRRWEQLLSAVEGIAAEHGQLLGPSIFEADGASLTLRLVLDPERKKDFIRTFSEDELLTTPIWRLAESFYREYRATR